METKGLKRGDRVWKKTHPLTALMIVGFAEGGVLAFHLTMNDTPSPVAYYCWQLLEVPEPPRAEPGVLYRWSDDHTRYVGLANGRVRRVAYGSYKPAGRSECDWTYDFKPNEMTRV